MAVMILMSVCGARVGVIATDENLRQTATGQSKRSVKAANLRGDIYDCNGELLTNAETSDITVVFPSEQGVAVLSELVQGDELKAAAEKLSKGNVVTLQKKYYGKSNGAVGLSVPKRYLGSLVHLIGYTDSTGHGVSGIEKGFDEILYNASGISVSYTSDPYGRMLVGDGFSAQKGNNGSITLTIDKSIQEITERAMSNVDCGAALVMDAKNGKIRAMVSRPWYDADNVADFLNSKDSPLINRALYAYNVGSVFKPLIAAAALEKGLGNYKYNCTGSIVNGDLTFKCNRITGHGELDLKGAISESCNTYFYTLAGEIGAESIYETASNLWFGRGLDLGGGIVSGNGNLPELHTLQNSSSALINLSIGQGELLLSPVAIANLYSAIVNGGVYRMPTVVEGIEQNGAYTKAEDNLSVKAMSRSVAATLKEYLIYTLKEGTGSSAYVDGLVAGGKTGTAQTGWKEGDRKILNGWFCGFVEAEKTEYVIVILKEDVTSGSLDCAPIFKSIASSLGTVNKSKSNP